MINRRFEEVNSLIRNTDNRWSDKAYVISLRLKCLALELFNLFLANSIKLVPDCSFENPLDIGKKEPVILALWHGSLLGCLYFLRNRNIAAIASLSKDGDLITKGLDSLGYQTIRGSSSRGGTRVLLEALKKLKKGTTVTFTIDGPKGPIHEVKPGIIMLAQKTGIPIVPLCMAYGKSITLHSWDRFQIPLPFSKSVIHIGKPLKIDSGISIDDGCKLLKEYMFDCEKIAAQKLKAGCL